MDSKTKIAKISIKSHDGDIKMYCEMFFLIFFTFSKQCYTSTCAEMMRKHAVVGF